MPSPAAIDFRSEKSLSTDDISLLCASLGGPDDPVRKRELKCMGSEVIEANEGMSGSWAEFILQTRDDCQHWRFNLAF